MPVQAPRTSAIRSVLTIGAIVWMAFMIVQALGYGVGFALDPASGVGEFASEPPDVPNDLTVALVGLVGVGMLGMAALLAMAASLMWRARPSGAWLAMIGGSVYVAAGLSAFRAGWAWDGWFYVVAGGVLVSLAAGVSVLQAREAHGA